MVVETASLVDALDRALPQTQCTRCGFPTCRDYAEAIAGGKAGIDRCPPGGAAGIEALARLTGRPATPLDPVHGIEGPRQRAVIDEASCIGCTLCLDACPVDCIVGGPKSMHVVITALCTGCELCLPVCPVDCIGLDNASGARTGWDAWSAFEADRARERFSRHRDRLERDRAEEARRLAASAAIPVVDPAANPALHAAAAAALARARAARGG